MHKDIDNDQGFKDAEATRINSLCIICNISNGLKKIHNDYNRLILLLNMVKEMHFVSRQADDRVSVLCEKENGGKIGATH